MLGVGCFDGQVLHLASASLSALEREFFIDNRLVRIHLIIVMSRWTGLAPWEFEFPLPGSLTSTFLESALHFERCSFAIKLHRPAFNMVWVWVSQC